MKIQKIHIVDFKCIDDLTIDFENIKGFWEIEGDVGTGKTTIGEALLYGLFGAVRQKNNASLITWGKKHAQVEVWAVSKNKHLYINRKLNAYGQSPLNVTIDGQPIVFTNKRDAQSQLEQEYFDTSRLMLETLCIISFNGFKSLSSLNPKDTNEFLDQAFGFRVITEYANACTEELKEDSHLFTKYNTDVHAIERQINGVKEWQKNDEHVTPQMVKDAQKQWTDTKAEYDKQRKEMREKNQSLQTIYQGLKSELAVIKSSGASVKKNIDFISKGVCPTCGQPLDQSHLQEHQNERERLLEKYKEVNAKCEQAAKDIIEYERQSENQLKPLDDKLSKLDIQIHHYQDQIQQQQRWTQELAKLEDELADTKMKQDQVQQSMDQWTELSKILSRDIRDKVLASLVPTINSHIQAYMTQLHQPYIVEFDESFTCHIQITNMDDPIPISSLSTGQLKVVDMVIILSILKTLLSNVQFNVVFLDELLSNMHEELRDMMCDMLRDNILEGQTMFIISHAALKQEYFDGRIKVSNHAGVADYEIENF